MADLVGSRPKGPRLAGWAAAGAALVVLGVVGGWALRTMLAPAPDVLGSPGYTLVTARQATVEQSLRLNTSARWLPARVAPNQAVGVVTTVEVKGATRARPGTVLYTVDLRPVVAAAGKVPAFRDLSYGVRGQDVAQLQRMLSARASTPAPTTACSVPP